MTARSSHSDRDPDTPSREWELLVRAAWSGPVPPQVVELLKAAADEGEDALVEVIAADIAQRQRRDVTWRMQDYAAALPSLLDRPAPRRTLLMAALAGDASLGPTTNERAISLRLLYPARAEEIEELASLAAMLASAASGDEQHAPGVRRGKYVLRTLLGRGAFAETWLASDEMLGRDIALKLIPARGLTRGDRSRVLAEARALAKVRHTSVVAIHEAGEFVDAGEVFLDMELVQVDNASRTLATALQAGPMSPVNAAKLVAAVAHGLAAAHSRGVLHRDIKPGNILLDASEHPRLCDFGLAIQAGSDANLPVEATKRRAIVGTPAYISPEVAAGLEATPLSDVFSLGATLRALVTGVDPRSEQSGDSREVLRLASSTPLSSLARQAPDVPATLAAIADRATAHAPESRYDSASGFAADLEAFIAMRATAARPLSAIGHAGLWFARNRVVASVTLAAAIALAALSTAFVVRLARERDAAEAATIQAKIQRDAAIDARDAIRAQNSFVSRSFNSARGMQGPERRGGDASVRESLLLIGQRADSTFADRPLILASVHAFLAQGFESIGDYTRAEQSARRAVALRERLLARTDPDTLAADCVLARVLLAQRKTEEGHQIVRRVFADITAADEWRSADGLWIRTWMARIDDAESRRDKARADLESVVADYRNAPFDGSMDRQAALNELVTFCLRAKQYDAASQHQQEIVDLLTSRYGAKDISTLYAQRTQVLILRRQNRLDDAAAFNLQLLTDFRQIVSPNHRALIDTLMVQAQIELERGRPEAMAFAKEAADATAGRPASSRERLNAQVLLGRAQHLSGDSPAAQATLRAAFEDALKPNAPASSLADASTALQSLLRDLGQTDEADRVAKRTRDRNTDR
jgi:Protein kinase domain